MAYKVIPDTNIVFDIFHRHRPFYDDANQLFYHLDQN